jgi:hypothetical protein
VQTERQSIYQWYKNKTIIVLCELKVETNAEERSHVRRLPGRLGGPLAPNRPTDSLSSQRKVQRTVGRLGVVVPMGHNPRVRHGLVRVDEDEQKLVTLASCLSG